jgi:hypothetical protein
MTSYEIHMKALIISYHSYQIITKRLLYHTIPYHTISYHTTTEILIARRAKMFRFDVGLDGKKEWKERGYPYGFTLGNFYRFTIR